MVTILLHDNLDTNGCLPGGDGGPTEGTVYFDVPAAVGTYKVSFNNLVTFSRIVNGQYVFYNLSSGDIEITTYDTTQGRVVGKLNTTFDAQNYMNGTFDVVYCK